MTHEHMHVERQEETHIVHDAAAEQRHYLWRFTQFIWLIAAAVELAILARIFLRLIAANPASPIAAFTYAITDVILFPFYALVPSPSVEGSVLDIPALIAMPFYLLGFWILVKVIWLLFDRPASRSVTTVQTSEPVTHEHHVVREQPVVERVVREEPVVERVVYEEEPVVEERVVKRVVKERRDTDL